MPFLSSLLPLGDHLLRWLTQPRPAQSRPASFRPRLEALADRILPSVDVTDSIGALVLKNLGSVDFDQARFKEIPKAADATRYWGVRGFSISTRQITDILNGVDGAEHLGTPVVTRQTVQIGGQSFDGVNLQFGSTISICLVFADVGKIAAAEPGAQVDPISGTIGGLIQIQSDGLERRFLLNYDGPLRDGGGDGLGEGGFDWLRAPWFLPPLLPFLRDGQAAQSALERPASGGHWSVVPTPLEHTVSQPPPVLLTSWPAGEQIARGLNALDSPEANDLAALPGNTTGNLENVLLTVDTALPDAQPDLVRLRNADLAVLPTYFVSDHLPAAPNAIVSRSEETVDLTLAAQVLGLEESRAILSEQDAADELFRQLASAGAVDRSPDIDVPSQVSDINAAFAGPRRCDSKCGVVPALALEGLAAYMCWRACHASEQRSRSKRSDASPTLSIALRPETR